MSFLLPPLSPPPVPPSCPKARQTAPKHSSWCVSVCMHASVNPFNPASALSKQTPSMTPVPLVLVRGVGRKGLWVSCRSQARPRAPLPARAGPGICCVPWICVAAVTDASIASLWDAPVQSCIPFHTSETGGKDNYTHIQHPLPQAPPPPSRSSDVRPFSGPVIYIKNKKIPKFYMFANKWHCKQRANEFCLDCPSARSLADGSGCCLFDFF